MSIFSTALQAAGPGITAATQAVGGYQQGQLANKKNETAQMVQIIQMKRQQEQEALAKALGAANIAHLGAETTKLGEPKKTYDSARGVMIDEDKGNFTPIAGLPEKPPPPRDPSMIPGTKEWTAAEVKKAQIGNQYGYHAPQPIVQIQGPDGNPVWSERDNAIGKNAKVTTRIESAQNTAAKARLEAAVSEMNNAHSGMSEYETKLRNGTANINGLQQFAGRVANSFTHDDPASMTIQSAALAALNNTNPELARYIRRGLSFAEGESMVSQRPSDFRTKMAAFLSTAASGASPEMIGDIESRRTSILNPLNASVTPHSAPHAQSSGDVDLRDHATQGGTHGKTYTYGGKTYVVP